MLERWPAAHARLSRPASRVLRPGERWRLLPGVRKGLAHFTGTSLGLFADAQRHGSELPRSRFNGGVPVSQCIDLCDRNLGCETRP